MNINALKEVLLDQRYDFFAKKNLIERDVFLDEFIKSKQIILISGVRRCGKSSLLYLISQKLKISNDSILYFNFDDERLSSFAANDFNKLYLLHLELYNVKDNEVVMFFDEPQNISGWEKFLSRMYEKGIKIYATGSNAKLLSSEIATTLTGRNLVIKLFPFSFKEFLKIRKFVSNVKMLSTTKKSAVKKLFNEYAELGGYPLVVKEKNPQILVSYYQDILYRDIIVRYSLQQVEEIKILGSFLASNPSCLMSYRKLKGMCGLKSLSTLKSYLHYFEQSFLFFFVKKYDFSIKKQIMNPAKVYLIDTGLHNKIGFKFSSNYGKILENIVFLNLVRNGKDVFYHKSKNECDFVVRNNIKIVEAIQVTASLDNPDTYKREISGLLDAMNYYNLKRGFILTESDKDNINIEGKKIIVRPVWEWLITYK